MFVRILTATLSLTLGACTTSNAQTEGISQAVSQTVTPQQWAQGCEPWDDWDKPAPPFKVHGDTYYVGTCGIASILIMRDGGNALIDSGTENGADVIRTNIETVGVNPRGIGIMLSSHEHFDHVGGMAKIQEIFGGLFISSEIGIAVMSSGVPHPDDPQFGMHKLMRRIDHGLSYADPNGEFLLIQFEITPIPTPGHSPGALSWQWQSCDGDDCKTIVYADSLSPVSRDDYRFSDHSEYVVEYRAGIDRLAALDCDILLTPHPSHSKMVERAATGTFEGGVTCSDYADGKLRDLDARLAREAEGDQ